MITLRKKHLLIAMALSLGFAGQAKATPFALSDGVKKQASYVLISNSAEGQKAEDFIAKMGEQALSFLSDNNLSQSQKESKFRQLLENSFSMSTIGRFSMGRHWRTASKAQQIEYQKLFKKKIVKVYSSRFNEYKGQGFEVVSHRVDGKKDFLVNSHVIDKNGSKVKVDWRVRHKNGKSKVIDIIIEGVSMSLTQRSDFSSVIQRGGGNVEALLEHLRK